MPETNWTKVKDLFHETLQRESGERSTFLNEACEGDADLRNEVESLLLSLNDADNFMETPVIGEATNSGIAWQFESGRQISHYRIVEAIGSGGMGEVYLADDLRLGRQVALKILPQDMLDEPNRLRRFEREARTVSALNHPNILTIYDFQEQDGIHLFASEYVKGITLRQKLDLGKLEVVETLEIAIQITSALQAAHDAGVVHRDIKPENLMIRDDGYIKVLDFGLAKIKESISEDYIDTAALTQRFSLPGVIMGTVAYMSPEQARGTHVDFRSDIFNLGIVMYEMLAGQPPFTGETAADIMAGIIRSDPMSASSSNPDVPVELDEIVSKALAKDRNDRFQNAQDLLARLKSLLKRIEFDAELERTAKTKTNEGIRARRTNPPLLSLPGELSSLVGRESEIEELTDLMIGRGARLVTLIGIGGTGKTRLAREMCRRLEGSFIDGVFFVRLAELRDPTMIAMVIAQQLRIQEIVGTPIAETLKDSLRNKHMLLVIDNFEQIVEAGPFVSDLLAAASQLVVLATSRERLNVTAEIEYNVPPLAVPDEDIPKPMAELAKFDSVRLFVERAQQASPDFQLSEENGWQVAKICLMLDGLPLAIELAAARTRIFSPALILEKLEGRLAFLTGGPRDLPKRQQTMRAAVEWSYDLLNEDEKRLFRRLSVFACRFTAAAAETVVSDANDVECLALVDIDAAHPSVEFLDLFTSLADKSLVIRRKNVDGNPTYRLLEIVREYAESVLESDDEADQVRRRHALLYLTLAEEAEPHLRLNDSGHWIGLLEEEHDNLRAALLWSIKKEPQIASRLAAAIRHFWLIRGHLSEGLRWAKEILDQNMEMPPDINWKILTACGNITQFQGDIGQAFDFYEQSLAAARRSGNQTDIAQSLRGLGAMAYLKYDFADARTLLKEALTISQNSGDDFGVAAALARLGDISNVEGDVSAARDLTSESLAIFRRIGYREGISAKLYNLGAIVFMAGDHEAARRYFEESHVTALELGEKINTRLIFDGFAALAADEGDYPRAARLSGAADSLGTTIGYSVEPAEKIFRDAYLTKLRAVMTDDEFEAEHASGRQLTTEQARDLAYPRAEARRNFLRSSSKGGLIS